MVSQTKRRNKFIHNGHYKYTYILVNVCHIVIEESKTCNDEEYHCVAIGRNCTRTVHSYTLWHWEVNLKKKIQKLYHIQEKDLNPNRSNEIFHS